MNYTHSVTVFCGSHTGNTPLYTEAAKTLGIELAKNHYRLVFGGGSVGLMGVLSNTMLDHGGIVKGIIPDFLIAKEGQHSRLKAPTITKDMHSRKSLMYKEADAFLVLPGGIGTFDEFFEILTWKYLKLHNKPILIIDVDNWAEPLLALLQHTIMKNLAAPSLLQEFKTFTNVSATLEYLKKALS